MPSTWRGCAEILGNRYHGKIPLPTAGSVINFQKGVFRIFCCVGPISDPRSDSESVQNFAPEPMSGVFPKFIPEKLVLKGHCDSHIRLLITPHFCPIFAP